MRAATLFFGFLFIVAAQADAQDPGDWEFAVFGRFTHYSDEDGIRARSPGLGGRLGYYLTPVRIGNQHLLLSAHLEGSVVGYRPRDAPFDTLRLEHEAYRGRFQLSPSRRTRHLSWFIAGALTYDRFPVQTDQQQYRSGLGFTPVLGFDLRLPRRTRVFLEGLTTFSNSGSKGASIQVGLAWTPAFR